MMEIDPPIHFPTKDHEIKYWMDIAHKMYQRNEATMREMHEYQESSQYLEKELESSFWESDKKNRNLSHENFKLIAQNEELRLKLDEQVAAYDALHTEVQELKLKNLELVNNIRDLEQKNDDFERDNRALKLKQENMESQYDDAIEKIALLETDLLEENYAKFDLERLEKENEDLKRRLESILEESKNDFLRTRKDINRVRSTAYNIACSASFNIITQNQREPEVRRSVSFMKDNLATSSPVKRKVQEEVPIIQRKEKYNTEGRELSQAFARYNQKQQDIEHNGVNRSVEMRAKKVKEEEKRQRILSSFVKRIRTARNQLLRRNE